MARLTVWWTDGVVRIESVTLEPNDALKTIPLLKTAAQHAHLRKGEGLDQ